MAEIDINRIKNNNKSKMISRNNHVDINKYKRLPIPQTCENSETYDITADFIKIKEDKNGVQTFEAAIPLCPNQIKNPLLLRFDSVGYQTELFINEVYLKSHYGSYTTWECEIPDKMKADGTLAVRLQLKEGEETLSKWQRIGIFRSIRLITLPKCYLNSLEVTAEYCSEENKGAVKVAFAINKVPELDSWISPVKPAKISLLSPDRQVLDEKHIAITEVEMIQDIYISNPELWDSEHTRLYEIILEIPQDGREPYIYLNKFGICKIQIQDKELYINQKPVKLRGICYREPLRGEYGFEKEEKREQLKQLREANINYLRVLYYPPSLNFLELCDEMGFYVEEGPAILGVGEEMPPTQNLPHLKNQYLEQFAEMLERDRHHPSILIWSLGCQSTWGSNFKAEYQYVKQRDRQRPAIFHYPMSIPLGVAGTDIWSCKDVDYRLPLNESYDHMTIGHTQGAENAIGYAIGVDEASPLPVLHDEFARIPSDCRDAMKRDPGIHEFYGESIKRFADRMYREKGCLGGAVFAAFDECETEEGIENCSQWGMMDRQGVRKPEYYHIKKSYSPIKIYLPAQCCAHQPEINTFTYTGWQDMNQVTVELENRYNHTKLSELDIYYRIEKYKEGAREDLTQWIPVKNIPDILPGEKGKINLNIPPDRQGIEKLHIMVKNQNWVVEQEMIELPGQTEIPLLCQSENIHKTRHMLSYTETEQEIIIYGEDFCLRFSRETGLCTEGSRDNVRIIREGPCLQMEGIWLKDWKCSKIEVRYKDIPEGSIEIETEGSYESGCRVRFLTQISPSARITVIFEILEMVSSMPQTVKIKSGMDCGGLEELGISFLLDEQMNHLNWRRKGIWSVYEKGHIGRRVGSTAFTKADSNFDSHDFASQSLDQALFGPYDFEWRGSNDFCSMKHHIYEASLKDKDGYGICVIADGRDSVRAVREPAPCDIIDDRNPNIHYHGTWYEVRDNSGCIRDTETVSNNKGDYAEYTFNGTGIVWYASSDMVNGMADVYIDGKIEASHVSLYPAQAEFIGMSRGYEKRYRTIAFSIQNLDAGSHTIKIHVTGEKQKEAQNCYVSLDAFQILGSEEPGGTRLFVLCSYNYRRLVWGNYKNTPVLPGDGTKHKIELQL